ncbi:MAG: Ig-like domain-containing protein [Pseudomonadota bacterium]
MNAFSLFASACITGLLASHAAAEGDHLTIPQNTSSNVVLTMDEGLNGPSPEDTLRVFVGPKDQCCAGKTPMSGTYSVTGNSVTFDPAFEFLEGQAYTIQTADGALHQFKIASANQATAPSVLAIYPSGSAIPENTLRFYIQFSAPMMPHQAEQFIELVSANGEADREAFMSFKQELWSADRTRLTLLMDPGRIKRGVAQNTRLGPALVETQSYAIVVRDGWPGATGGDVALGFEHAFHVDAALRSIPSPDAWDITPPAAGSREPISITFDRPFDRFQTLESLRLEDADGAVILGEAWLENNETVWRFAPLEPWEEGDLNLLIDARLEDVAGNNFRDTLDHSVGTPTREIDQIVIPISVSAQ